MKTYRVPYNAHRYSDSSDPAQPRIVQVGAFDLEGAEETAVLWREDNESGIVCRGRRHYIGMIHFGQIAEIQPPARKGSKS